ncbi:MAG: hypothetical protein CM15mP124_7490 [Alphaproteobacteria bacterium]|nr:MAG: hypothetical protein CM15mP124_7490 [Alphaproteobacteria bacterium]
MTCFSYTNGKFIPSYKARFPINDRSLHFSDAVYEVVTFITLECYFGRIT